MTQTPALIAAIMLLAAGAAGLRISRAAARFRRRRRIERISAVVSGLPLAPRDGHLPFYGPEA